MFLRYSCFAKKEKRSYNRTRRGENSIYPMKPKNLQAKSPPPNQPPALKPTPPMTEVRSHKSMRLEREALIMQRRLDTVIQTRIVMVFQPYLDACAHASR